MTAVLPPARVAIAGNAPPSREWYRYFQAATKVNLDVGTLRHDVDALTVRVTALEETTPSGGDTKITGTGSIYVSATAVKVVSLEGDAEDPGFTTYYGTDSTGAKGWYAVSDALANSGNIAKSTDAAGVTSFDLVDLTDSGTGAALVKITRDAKGRISGTSAATTTDLAEGTNLYYTDARVRATALTGLSTATATPVTATDSVLVGVGKLQGQASAATTAIAGKEPSITPGTTAQYWRGDKSWRDFATDVRTAVLTGLSTATSAVISATDTVLGALGKLQAQISLKMNDASVAALAESNAVQSIPSGTFQKVLLGTEVYDSGFYDPATSRFTPTNAGKYVAVGMVSFSGTGPAGNRIIAAATKNGTVVSNMIASTQTFTTNSAQHIAVYDMNGTTDYLELFARYDAGVSLSITGTGNTSMTVYRIGA